MPLRAGYAVDITNNGETYRTGYFTSSALASAIAYAANNKANIINLSLGGSSGSNVNDIALTDAVKYAQSKNCIVVAASGNDNADITANNIMPASVAGVFAVGSVSTIGNRSSFSNYGSRLDFVAPGENIYSLKSTSDSSYGALSGTSMATPQVSGLCALILSYDKSLTPSNVYEVIKRSVTDKGETGKDRNYGYGLVNARSAMGLLKSAILNKGTDPLLFGPEGLLKGPLNYPNPFNPGKEQTKITYSLTDTADIKISIYSLSMQRVKNITRLSDIATYHEVPWDGRDNSGYILPNGVYIMVIDARSQTKHEVHRHRIAILQ